MLPDKSAYLPLLAVPLLLQMFWQDVRTRTINLGVLMLSLCLLAATRLVRDPLPLYGMDTGLNLAWIGMHLLMLCAYLSVRQGLFTAPVGRFMGWGDAAFWLVPAFFFPPGEFVFFWLASSVFALAAHFCLKQLPETSYAPTIPLAGLQALWMAATLVLAACEIES